MLIIAKLSIIILSVIMHRVIKSSVTYAECHNKVHLAEYYAEFRYMLSAAIQSVVTLIVVNDQVFYAKCHYAQCRYV
jgi:hypothetical protein